MYRKVEYRVRPVTRYIVTRYEETENASESRNCGEFDNEVLAGNAILAFGEFDARDEQVEGDIINEVVTRRPMFGSEEVRTWHWGKGWDDDPVKNIE